MSAQRKKTTPARGPFPVVPVVVAVAVILAAIIAVVATRGGDDKGSDTSADGTRTVEETRPVAVTGTPLAAYTGDASDPAVGSPIPTLAGKSFFGNDVAIRPDGRPKVIMFLAHWCPHCRNEVPVIAKWLQQNGMPKDVDLYAVSTGVNENAANYPPSRWLEHEQFDVPTIADDAKGTGAEAFGLKSFPYFVAADATGKVVVRAAGELPISSFEQLLAAAKGG